MWIVRYAYQVPHGQQCLGLEEQDRAKFYPLGLFRDLSTAIGRILLGFRSSYVAGALLAKSSHFSSQEVEDWWVDGR